MYIRDLLLLFIFLAIDTPLSVAQSVTPTRLELNLEESAQAILTLSSTKPVDVALELSIADYSAAGGEVDAPLEIVPPQMVLRPGETRRVLVRWRGEKRLPVSKSYYLAIDELPLTVGAQESDAEIQLLTSWRLPVHVEVGGKPEVDFFAPHIDGSASIELKNTGRQYALLSHYEIGVKGNREVVVLDGLDLARLLNRDALLPGQTVSIPLRLIGLGAVGLQGASLLKKE
ncbi:fimbrial biogenesis chaperone [Microbulbifer hainanensis]|uniref:fimbrial biogenesis chaperone n=1 Tax=Microbulbifer hainanensis TaxID=2735675 RepID=UPI00186744D5|nr:fimbria/pilus periplasmic chaperone [Microbulbifer hainanensis]